MPGRRPVPRGLEGSGHRKECDHSGAEREQRKGPGEEPHGALFSGQQAAQELATRCYCSRWTRRKLRSPPEKPKKSWTRGELAKHDRHGVIPLRETCRAGRTAHPSRLTVDSHQGNGLQDGHEGRKPSCNKGAHCCPKSFT